MITYTDTVHAQKCAPCRPSCSRPFSQRQANKRTPSPAGHSSKAHKSREQQRQCCGAASPRWRCAASAALSQTPAKLQLLTARPCPALVLAAPCVWHVGTTWAQRAAAAAAPSLWAASARLLRCGSSTALPRGGTAPGSSSGSSGRTVGGCAWGQCRPCNHARCFARRPVDFRMAPGDCRGYQHFDGRGRPGRAAFHSAATQRRAAVWVAAVGGGGLLVWFSSRQDIPYTNRT